MKPSKLLTALNVLSKVQSGDEQTPCHLPPPAPISDFHKALKWIFDCCRCIPYPKKTFFVNTQLKFLQIRISRFLSKISFIGAARDEFK